MFFVASLMYMIALGIEIKKCRSHEENLQSELPSQSQTLSSAPPHPRSNPSPAEELSDSSSVQASTPPSTQNGEDGEISPASTPSDPDDLKAPPSYESTLIDLPPYETAF